MNRIDPDVLRIGRATYLGCTMVRDFMIKLNGRVKDVEPDEAASVAERHRIANAKGYFHRALAWTISVCKLGDPSDFQAVITAVRALLEITVDVALLRHDAANHASEKVFAWERSAKLKLAESVKNHFDGKPLPAEYTEVVAFVDREHDAIVALREQWWGLDRNQRTRHPDRWTGRSLADDVTRAKPLLTQYGSSLDIESFYRAEFSKLCWNTHGSGFAGMRDIPEERFPALIAIAYRHVIEFSLLVTRMATEELGVFLLVEYSDFIATHANATAAAFDAPIE
jgi:hypothetical protein